MTMYRNATIPASLWQVIHALPARSLNTLRTWQQRRCERYHLRCLLRLDDRLLEDIGLNWASVAWEASRPFWKPLALDFVPLYEP
jgi:uncharacterized protein YjiS (DUF1127 family)